MQFKSFHWLSHHGMSHYTMLTNMVSVRVGFYVYFILVFYIMGVFLIKQLFYLHLLDEMIIANSALRFSLAIYHLISNSRSWNNC